MPTITVKNIPAELYEKLKQTAAIRHRSINREIIACIELAVSSHPVNPEELLITARKLREKTAPYQISEQELNQIKKSGRL